MVAIPKSINKSRIEQNIDIFDFQLTEEEKSKLGKILSNLIFDNLKEFRSNAIILFLVYYGTTIMWEPFIDIHLDIEIIPKITSSVK